MSSDESSPIDTVKNAASRILQDREEKSEPTQIRDQVPIRRWFQEKYIGSMARNLWPFWREEIVKLFEGDYSEWIITGSLSSGKTTGAAVALTRKNYELTTYDYPQRFVGLDDTSQIYSAYFSVTASAAQDTGFSDIYSIIENSSYFVDEVGMDEDISSEVRFPSKNLKIISGSTKSTVLGKNLISSILDEANFWKSGGSSGDLDKIRSIYNEVTDRRQTRFVDKGWDPGISILVSSSATDSSFTEKRKEKAGDQALVTKARIFQVKSENYSDVLFPVFKGSENMDAQVVRDREQLLEILEKLELKNLLDEEDLRNLKIIERQPCDKYAEEAGVSENLIDSLCAPRVRQLKESLHEDIAENFVFAPLDFKKRFEDDPVSSIQNVGGEAVGQRGSFFSDRESWNECIDDSLTHPFSLDAPVITTERSEDQLIELFQPRELCEPVKEKDNGEIVWQPRHRPESPRSIHIDLGEVSDPAAMSMSHVSEVDFDEDLGVTRPEIEMDFMLRMRPPEASSGRIYFDAIENFVFALSRRFGFEIASITLDQYQSSQLVQNFNNQLFKNSEDKTSEVFSTDSDDEHWIWTARSIAKKKISMYRYEPLEQEWFELIHDRDAGKVDHPKTFDDGSTGHDDVSDSFVGSIWNLTKLPSSSSEDVGGRGDVGIEDNNRSKQEVMKESYQSSKGTRPFQDEKDAMNEKTDSSLLSRRM